MNTRRLYHGVTANKYYNLDLIQFESGAPVSNNCRGPTPFEIINYLEAQTTPFGTHGCDAPLRLINLVLNKINEIDPDIEVLLVSGDFVSHGYAVEIGMSDHYFVLKEIIEYVFIEILAKKFPNAVHTINISINSYFLNHFFIYIILAWNIIYTKFISFI